MRKPLTKWAPRLDGCSYRYRAGSHFAPLRSPGLARACEQTKTELRPIGEWIDEWAAGGSAIHSSCVVTGSASVCGHATGPTFTIAGGGSVEVLQGLVFDVLIGVGGEAPDLGDLFVHYDM